MSKITVWKRIEELEKENASLKEIRRRRRENSLRKSHKESGHVICYVLWFEATNPETGKVHEATTLSELRRLIDADSNEKA